MPMKAMIYKTLSTVVDDFFAYDFTDTWSVVAAAHVLFTDFASRCPSCIDWHVSATTLYS